MLLQNSQSAKGARSVFGILTTFLGVFSFRVAEVVRNQKLMKKKKYYDIVLLKFRYYSLSIVAKLLYSASACVCVT